ASRTDNPHATTAAQVGAAPSSHVGSGGSAHAVATTATSGFMSYTDKIKLDGIDIGATTAKIINLVSGYITNTNSTSPSEIKGTHIIWHSDYAGSRNIYFVVEGYTQNGGTAYYKLKDETSGTDIVTISTTSIGMPVIISSSNISIPDGHEIKAYMWISSTSYYVNVQSVRIMIL
ncbi:MAG: hypothetical protein QJR05_08230, partial [Thermoanaerobacterium sp.]|nr:hypothetical protein [Thermoanaerobacterium sp.]